MVMPVPSVPGTGGTGKDERGMQTREHTTSEEPAVDAVGLLLEQIAETLPQQRDQLRALKARVASHTHTPLIRNDALLARYRREVTQGLRRPNAQLERILRLNRVRSESGMATVTVMTKPYACPGRCVYCPTEARAPKSYLTNEPAMLRALRNDYDPARQVASRLQALQETGHPTDKIELIIKGGTWSFYPEDYQQEFIHQCYEAANTFAYGSTPERQHAHQPTGWETVQQQHETARHRIIGITVETRPDYVTPDEIRRLRLLGVTRVELGVQTLEESVLALTVRDHGTAEVRQATRLLKNAGFKVAYHLMPNLPGATPHSDLESARTMFTDPAYCPDAVKLYPCVVIATAELYQWWQDGRYQPYDDATLLELLAEIKQLTPPYVRLERIIRDIPSTSIVAGCRVTNLREAVACRLREQRRRCRCIRCRQVRSETTGTFQLSRLDYEASDGHEVFLSFDDPATDHLAAFLRLRIPASHTQDPTNGSFPVLTGAALIRELHAYGPHLPLGHHTNGAIQHHGFGQRLLGEAERIAKEEYGLTRVAVIAGVGVRAYYRRWGYALQDTYMVKSLV